MKTFVGSFPKAVHPVDLSLAKFRRLVHRRAGNVCQLKFPGCHGRSAVAHHIWRKAQGGPNDPDNGLALCRSCHDVLHASPEVAFREGWLRREHPKPGDFHYGVAS